MAIIWLWTTHFCYEIYAWIHFILSIVQFAYFVFQKGYQYKDSTFFLIFFYTKVV